jgi:hypothetical protein
LTTRLGGEERLENPSLHGLVHSHAGVFDNQLDRIASGALPAFDAKHASVRHGVSGVHRQVEDDLLDLPRIGVDDRGTMQVEPQFDLLADDAREQPIEPRDDVGDIDASRLR